MSNSNVNDGTNKSQLQVVTFEVGPALLALEISTVQEINRNFNFTNVPHAPNFVRGVTNLRGEVVTIIDLHIVLDMEATEPTAHTRNLIVNHDRELIGLCVDRVADIMTISSDLSDPPSNLQGVPRKLIRGVHQAKGRLVMILDLNELLQSCNAGEAAA